MDSPFISAQHTTGKKVNTQEFALFCFILQNCTIKQGQIPVVRKEDMIASMA